MRHPVPRRFAQPARVRPPALTVLALLLAVLAATGCAPEERTSPVAVAPINDFSRFQPLTIGQTPAPDNPPWVSHLITVDLDQDGRLDVVFCEARDNAVIWLRQTAPGAFIEKRLAENMSAPVHVEAADMDGDGHLDLIVSAMGVVFPNNDRIGTVFILHNNGDQSFTPRAILENTTRVVDARPADLNGDGQLDLVLAQFGYDQGEVSWLERTGPWTFRRHVLLGLSGAINVGVADFDGNGWPDIAALISQQWEEVHVFTNHGKGTFSGKRIWGSTNEDYGSSGLVVADLNADGRPDLLHTNGDGFGPSSTPGPRPWHGVQWQENLGNGRFTYHRVGHLPGAYSPIAVDLDGDGAMDIVASAAYADWNNANRDFVSLVWFRNDGQQNFVPHALARQPKDLITLAAGDFGGGLPSLVTGGFYIYPPYDNLSRITLWRQDDTP